MTKNCQVTVPHPRSKSEQALKQDTCGIVDNTAVKGSSSGPETGHSLMECLKTLAHGRLLWRIVSTLYLGKPDSRKFYALLQL